MESPLLDIPNINLKRSESSEQSETLSAHTPFGEINFEDSESVYQESSRQWTSPYAYEAPTNDNPHRIDIQKAIKLNKKYQRELWGTQLPSILNYFRSKGFSKDDPPPDSAAFALLVAQWQAGPWRDITIDGALGPKSWSTLKPLLSNAPVSAPVVRNTLGWPDFIKDTVSCPAEPLLHGAEAYKRMVAAIRTANSSSHYIYILGWMLDIDFEMIPGDPDSTMTKLLTAASQKGVEIRVQIWDNPFYKTEINKALRVVNNLPRTLMVKDDYTFGSTMVKTAIATMRGLVSQAPIVLDLVQAWKDFKDTLYTIENEGSHHEKIVVVKGSDGLIAFCGGIDINPNRVVGVDDKHRSKVLHDVHCEVRGSAAWSLLHRFMWRWQVLKEKYPWMALLVNSLNEPKPGPIGGPNTAHVKILQTFNHPSKRIKDRSIRETVKIAIARARQSIHIEDQYMISLEIATWLNAKLKDPGFKSVTCLTQDDEFAKEDLKFPQDMRRKFIEYLTKGLTADQIKSKVFVQMLHPDSPPFSHHRIHSKIYIIDDELVIIGSANCSSRSMTHDSETAAVFFNDPGTPSNFASKLRNRFKNDPLLRVVPYVANPYVHDLDEVLRKDLQKAATIGRVVSIVGAPVLSTVPVGSILTSFIPKLKSTFIDIIDPDADDTVPQQEIGETQFEMTNPLLDPQSMEGESPVGQDAISLNQQYSRDLGWGYYVYEINDLLLKATGQTGQSLGGETFVRAVQIWKEKNDMVSTRVDGVIDLYTWSKMAASLGVSPLIFSIPDAYAKMTLLLRGLTISAFRMACNGFRQLEKNGKLRNNRILSIADFKQSSRNKRLYILDLANQQVLIQTNVAHGKNSGTKEWATKFSNKSGSRQSSLGFYVTLETYNGKNGRSLHLSGQENGFNDNARARAIVVHGAKYVEEGGHIVGRSWGCPAVSTKQIDSVIDTIKDGTCYFIHYNDPEYLTKSSLISDPPFGSQSSVDATSLYRELPDYDEQETESPDTLGETEGYFSPNEYENTVEELEDEEMQNEWTSDTELPSPDVSTCPAPGYTAGPTPPLINEDLTVPGYTCYVNIDLGKGNYRMDMTGIYIPSSFNPLEPADIIVYLHGMTGTFPGSKAKIDRYWSVTKLPHYDFRLREEVESSGRNVILVAPSLGKSPNAYSNYLSGKKGGLDSYIVKIISAFTIHILLKRFNGGSLALRNIILAGHSAGGSQMRRIATGDNPLYGCKISECWGLDSMYGGVGTWLRWAKNNPGKKLFVYYLDSTAHNSRTLSNDATSLPGVFVKRSSAKDHYLVPKEHFKDRILKIGSTTLTKTNFEESLYEGENLDELDEETIHGNFVPSESMDEDELQGEEELDFLDTHEQDSTPEYEDFLDEINSLVTDWSKAIRLNGSYGVKLGWNQYVDKINDLILPFSGMQNVSLGGEAFARAVAAWQTSKGLQSKDADGIIGPNTWRLMQPLVSGTIVLPPQPGSGTPGGVTSSTAQAEWANNLNIRSRYQTWQAYDAVRKQVVSWGVNNPSFYIDSAISEWNANAGIHSYFGTRKSPRNFDGDPHNSYLNLKRLYNAKGIANPALYFATNIVTINFFGKKSPGHRDLKTKLDAAEATLKSSGNNYVLTDAYSFVPRTYNDNANKLSNHALGKAIDINYPTNPYIKSKEVKLVIETICQSVLPNGWKGASDPDTIRSANDLFKQTFSDAWVNKQTDHNILNAVSKNRSTLDRYARDGFFDLPSSLVRGLQNAGLSWGGAWGSSKDLMHFELV